MLRLRSMRVVAVFVLFALLCVGSTVVFMVRHGPPPKPLKGIVDSHFGHEGWRGHRELNTGQRRWFISNTIGDEGSRLPGSGFSPFRSGGYEFEPPPSTWHPVELPAWVVAAVRVASTSGQAARAPANTTFAEMCCAGWGWPAPVITRSWVQRWVAGQVSYAPKGMVTLYDGGYRVLPSGLIPWLLFAMLAVAAYESTIVVRSRMRVWRGRCGRCAYVIAPGSAQCPECGRAVR